MLAGRFKDRDRNWRRFVAGAAGKKMKTLGCQEATRRTAARSGGLSVMAHENKDGDVAQFLLQRHCCVLTGLVSDIWKYSFDLCNHLRDNQVHTAVLATTPRLLNRNDPLFPYRSPCLGPFSA